MIVFEEKTEPADLDRIARLAAVIWREHYTELVGPEQVEYMLERFQSTEALRRQVDGEGYRYFVAAEDDEYLGYCGIQSHPDDSGKLFLSKFYVKKAERGRGIGRKLLRHALRCHEPVPGTVLWLTVNKHNEASIAAYGKMGFRIADEMVTDIGDGFVMDDYRLECDVDELL